MKNKNHISIRLNPKESALFGETWRELPNMVELLHQRKAFNKSTGTTLVNLLNSQELKEKMKVTISSVVAEMSTGKVVEVTFTDKQLKILNKLQKDTGMTQRSTLLKRILFVVYHYPDLHSTGKLSKRISPPEKSSVEHSTKNKKSPINLRTPTTRIKIVVTQEMIDKYQPMTVSEAFKKRLCEMRRQDILDRIEANKNLTLGRIERELYLTVGERNYIGLICDDVEIGTGKKSDRYQYSYIAALLL